MKKIFILFIVLSTKAFSQNLVYDNFSTFNLSKIDGQGGWSSASPSTGNGSGACAGVSCIPVSVVSKSISYTGFGSCTQAMHPVDGILATGDGPGKYIGSVVNSGTLYLALLVNFSTPSSGTTPTAAKQVIRFMDNGFNAATRIHIKQSLSGGFQVGVDKNGSQIVYSGGTYAYGQDHLFVLKYQFNTANTSDDVASVFIDPDLSMPESSPIISNSNSSDVPSISRIVSPWNFSTIIPNGYIGIVSVAKDWNNIVPQAAPTYKIDGKIISPLNKAIPNSKISLTSLNIKDSTLSTTLGSYNFSNLSTNDFKIKPTKNNDITKNNGVSAFDVILTQNHILGKTKLNSPYKIIAADVNNNKTVTNIDLIFMKRLILGLDTTFTGNRLWAFVDSAYVFPDTTNPFPYKDSISFTNLTSNKTNQTFIGVKLGDVNYDWNAAVARGISSIDNVELIIDNEKLRITNDELRILISVKNFKELVAMQYTLNFNNKDFDFVAIENNKLGIEFNEKQATKNGSISFLWADSKGEEKTLVNGTEIFTLVLRSKLQLASSELANHLQLTINNSITEIEALDKDFNQHNIVLSQRIKNNEQGILNNEIWSVSPNPTNGDVVVSLVSNANKNIVLELSNAQGKTLYTQSFEAVKGNNNFNLNLKKKSNVTTGLYFLKALGIEGENVKKIIVNP